MMISLKRTIILSVLFIPALVFLISAVLFFYLPDYIETRLVHFLPKTTGIDRITLDVRKITPFETDIASLVIGDAKNPALKIESIRSDYSPGGLSQKSIKNVVISGVELYCNFYNGKFNLRGLDQKKIAKTLQSLKKQSGRSAGPGSPDFLPILINRLELRNAIVVCRYKETELRLPVEVVMIRKKDAPLTFKGIIKLYPRGQTIIITGSADLTKKIARITLKGNRVRLERFADLVKMFPGLVLCGAADLEATAGFRFDPLDITVITASCTIQEPELSYKNLLVKSAYPRDKQKRPVKIEITGKGLKEWNMNLSSLAIQHPINAVLNNLSCRLNVSGELKKAQGNFSFNINRTEHPGHFFIIDDTIHVNGSYHAKTSKNEAWEFKIKTDKISGQKQWNLRSNDLQLSTKAPGLVVSGKGVDTSGMLEYHIGISGLHAVSKYGSAGISEAALQGNVNFDFSESNTVQSTFKYNLTGTHFSFNSAKIGAPDVSVSGQFNRMADHTFRITSVTNFLNANIRESKRKIKANGIGLTCPFTWPPEKSGKKGTISVKSIFYDNIRLGSVKMSTRQQASGVAFQGKYTSALLKSLYANFSGTLKLSHSNAPKTEIAFNVPSYTLPMDIDIGQFFKPLQDMTGNGRFSLDGSLSINEKGTDSSANIHFTDGELIDPEKNLKIEGIRTDLLITDLFNLQSAPGQKLSFDKAALGEIKISNGNIKFQIESPESFLIEKSSFNWCKGNVYAHAVRILPGISDHNLTLFCDRINLAMLLRQFGTLNADGVGSVNGRIPIKFHKGKISFNDGFLYSTPGDGGTVKITGTDILTAGIPPNTLQYAQVELAREALKDYTYKWVKLGLTTEEENLYIKMEFDGKPSQPLPFVYNKDIGGFTKVRGNSKGSHFQGISLDVNFRVPINEILQYGEGLKKLLKMIN